jgi:hypothetical protein
VIHFAVPTLHVLSGTFELRVCKSGAISRWASDVTRRALKDAAEARAVAAAAGAQTLTARRTVPRDAAQALGLHLRLSLERA